MKTFMKSLSVLCFALLAITYTANAQGFKGVITFSMAYSGNIDAATAAQQPKLMTVSVMGNKVKTSLAVGPVVIDVVSDGDKKETITMIDMMGEKKYYKTLAAEIDEDLNKNGAPVIRYVEGTKTIAGYVCNKAEYVTKDEDDKETVTTVYYSTELGGELSNYGGSFQGLKGFPMEYVINKNEIITTIAVTEVKKGKVKETDFLIPAEYVELTAEEKAHYKLVYVDKSPAVTQGTSF
jgi:hypothetical protein